MGGGAREVRVVSEASGRMTRSNALYLGLCLLAIGGVAGVQARAGEAAGGGALQALIGRFAAPLAPSPAHQVSIESHISIRISPAAPGTGNPGDASMIVSFERHTSSTRFTERKIGNCLTVSAIGAVRGGDDKHLLLFMRDDSLVSAELQKACEAREFYSGFYVARNADGRICVGRDALQARTGANCKLKKLRALVPVAERR